MGVIRKVAILSVACVLMLFCSCKKGYFSTDISLYGISISEVYTHSAAAFYLSDSGELYCTGSDSDAASFVVYTDQRRGLVAENVKSFEEIVGGGCYIDRSNKLYMWNESEVPLYGYTSKKEHMHIMDNVRYIVSDTNRFIYIDTDSRLYLVGVWGDEEYSIYKPKFLGENVICADIDDMRIIWVNVEGNVDFYGKVDTVTQKELSAKFSGTFVSDVRLTREYIAVLSDGELWFYGDYEKLISGKASQKIELKCISGSVEQISCSRRTLALLDSNGNVRVWGRCVSNDIYDTKNPQYDYFEEISLTNNARRVFVSDSCICYVDSEGNTTIFYSSGWPAFYGNSTKDSVVGINRDGSTWVN